MEYPHHLIGPDFEKAELLTFNLGDINIFMRVPELSERRAENYIAPTDLSRLRDDDWQVDENNNRFQLIVEHFWQYIIREGMSFDLPVFYTELRVLLLEVPADVQAQPTDTRQQVFEQWIHDTLPVWAQVMTKEYYEREGLPDPALRAPETEDLAALQILPRENVDFIVTTFGLDGNDHPMPYIFIPLTEQYVMLIIVRIDNLPYSDMDESYPENDVMPVKQKMVMEFLEHIQIVLSKFSGVD